MYSANSQNLKKIQLKERAKGLMTIAIIGIPIFLAFVAYSLYQQATADPNTATEQLAQDLSKDAPQQIVTGEIPQGSTEPIPVASGSPSTTAPTAPSAGQTTPASSGIPAGVTTAMNSIEANGIKGNPYVSSNVDTSLVPAGTAINFDRSSWTSYSESFGSVNVTFTVNGQPGSGSITFSIEGGQWKASGYSINS